MGKEITLKEHEKRDEETSVLQKRRGLFCQLKTEETLQIRVWKKNRKAETSLTEKEEKIQQRSTYPNRVRGARLSGFFWPS